MYEHKIGATLSLAGAIVATAGETLPDFSTWVGSSQIRMLNGTLVESLVVSWVDVSTGKLKVYSNDTADWPAGVAEIDIKFTSTTTGQKVYSKTQQILLVKAVTYA